MLTDLKFKWQRVHHSTVADLYPTVCISVLAFHMRMFFAVVDLYNSTVGTEKINYHLWLRSVDTKKWWPYLKKKCAKLDIREEEEWRIGHMYEVKQNSSRQDTSKE